MRAAGRQGPHQGHRVAALTVSPGTLQAVSNECPGQTRTRTACSEFSFDWGFGLAFVVWFALVGWLVCFLFDQDLAVWLGWY